MRYVEPFIYIYQWDTPYGVHSSLFNAPYEGRLADRCVALFTLQQVQDVRAQTVYECAELVESPLNNYAKHIRHMMAAV
jgi:hypothetical protein